MPTLGFNDALTHVITLLQAINGGIEGVESAPIVAPSKVTTSKLPISMVWENDGTAKSQIGLSTLQMPFVIEVLMFTSTVGYKETNFEQTREMHARFLDAYTLKQSDPDERYLDYGQTSGVRVEIVKNQTIGFTGAQSAMEFMPQVVYYGFRLSVPIQFRWGSELI